MTVSAVRNRNTDASASACTAEAFSACADTKKTNAAAACVLFLLDAILLASIFVVRAVGLVVLIRLVLAVLVLVVLHIAITGTTAYAGNA